MKVLALFFFVSVVLAGFYESNADVIELNPQNFDKVVYGTNYTSVVEFYAPWCGYCQKLKRTYNRLGKYFKDMAVQVTAINCDLAENKPICSKYRVEGFPTLMVFRPPKDFRSGAKHNSELYRGEREFDPLVQFLKGRVKSYVSKVKPAAWPKFRDTTEISEQHKALLVTSKTSVPVTFKSLAIDFLGEVKFGYMPVKESEVASVSETLGLPFEKLPQLVVISGEDVHLYDGDMNKVEMSKFLQKFAKPREGSLSGRGKWLAKLGGSGRLRDEL